jgi:hypothetical protein
MSHFEDAASPDLSPRKKFSPQEDANLMMLVAQFGSLAWETISREMPGRNARQCRERWKHYLCVGFSERPWTKAEDDLLLRKRQELGPRWTKLSHLFQNRSDIQIKARWLKLTEKSVPAPEIRPISPQPQLQPHQDVDLLGVKQPGMMFEQFARFEKEWAALFDPREEPAVRNPAEFAWF